MIIKCTQVRARGPALKRLVAHIENAEDNEEVVALQGHFADIFDARKDAQQFGREIAAVHWIISPARFATDEQMLEAVDRLAAEFNFDVNRAVVRRHTKSKAAADPALFDGHVHVLAPAVDPTGAVMSSSHNFARNEKLSRILEYDWGGWTNPLARDEGLEPLLRGTHLKTVIATLENSERKDVAAALKKAFPDEQPRPIQSFDTANQQRLKRKGLDLPALRLLIEAAWNSAPSRSEFEMNLSEHALVARAGAKPGVVIIEDSAGEKIGSLARLVKITKAAVKAKMEKQDDRTEKCNDLGEGTTENDMGGSDVQKHAADQPSVGAVEAAGGTSARHPSARTDLDVGGDHPAVGGNRPTDTAETGSDHRTAGGAINRESAPRYAEGLIESNDFGLAFGLAAHAPALTRILGLATRNAMSQNERVAVEFGEIEEEARIARAMIDTHPVESTSLIEARDGVSVAKRNVETAQSVVDDAVELSTALRRPRPWWQRAIGHITGKNTQHAAKVQAALIAERKAQLTLSQADNHWRSKETQLALAVQEHRKAVKEHIKVWTERAKAAEAKALITARAREILQGLPGAAALGPAGLQRLATKFSHDGPRPDGAPTFSVLF